MDFVNVGNMFKTLVLSVSQTFYNQLDCVLKIPFNFHFIPPFIMNCLSIIVALSLHFLFAPEAWKESKSTKYWAFSIVGFAALALYVFAGIIVVLYKLYLCPDVLQRKLEWKSNRNVMREV